MSHIKTYHALKCQPFHIPPPCTTLLVVYSCHGIICPMLRLELCFSTPVSTVLLFYPPTSRFSTKFHLSFHLWTYWEHCIDINEYSISPLMNIYNIHCSAVISEWAVKNHRSYIVSTSISAGDTPILINPSFPVVVLLLVPELIESILTHWVFHCALLHGV